MRALVSKKRRAHIAVSPFPLRPLVCGLSPSTLFLTLLSSPTDPNSYYLSPPKEFLPKNPSLCRKEFFPKNSFLLQLEGPSPRAFELRPMHPSYHLPLMHRTWTYLARMMPTLVSPRRPLKFQPENFVGMNAPYNWETNDTTGILDMASFSKRKRPLTYLKGGDHLL